MSVRCDFCHAPHPAWRLPAISFELPDTLFGSTGDWLACDSCRALVEHRDRHTLLARATRITNLMPPQMRHAVRLDMRRLLEAFFQHWGGTVMPYSIMADPQ